ncbi:MAG: hypothetical protein HY558_04845 [Euryarchaeota archaeon]|nr:hypothetical protein [Euryarchaeota archaeon]
MEDLDALPEGEWFDVPEGLPTRSYYLVNHEKGLLTISLPREFRRHLRGKLRASIQGKKIVIEKA